MNKKFRIILDIVMTCLFIVLMGYYATDNAVHEILGGNKMQKNIGSKLALYPMPLLVIGTMVEGKANWVFS